MRLAIVPVAARVSGYSEKSVRNRIYDGSLTAYKVPGVRGTVVDLDQLAAVIAAKHPTRTVLRTVDPEQVAQ